MRQLSLALLVLVAAGCASSSRPASVSAPEIAVQAGSIFFGSSYSAPLTLDVAVRNTANVPLRLRNVRIDASGMSQYTIAPVERIVNQTLAPGETKVVSLFATAYTNRARLNVTEPLSVRALVELDYNGQRFREVVLRPLVSGP
ncbi:MAG TPA: hypothetical protein VF618_28010 [Thermoanaerobaculia bacterium]